MGFECGLVLNIDCVIHSFVYVSSVSPKYLKQSDCALNAACTV